MTSNEYVDIVFDGPPDHHAGKFVEVEDANGRSMRYGEWIHRPDGYWALRIPRIAVETSEPTTCLGLIRDGICSCGHHRGDGWRCVTCGHENPREALKCQNLNCAALTGEHIHRWHPDGYCMTCPMRQVETKDRDLCACCGMTLKACRALHAEKASEPRELTASEAASFSKTLARSPRVLEKAGARPTPQQLGERHADTLRALAEDVCKCRGKLGWTRDESGKAICTDCRLPITHPEKAKPAHTCKHGNDWLACKPCDGEAVKTNSPQLAMVPNQHHPGVGCSCRDCLTRYPSDPSEGKLVEYCLCGLIKPAPGVACAWCGTLNG
jgi:hypothetical protein